MKTRLLRSTAIAGTTLMFLALAPLVSADEPVSARSQAVKSKSLPQVTKVILKAAKAKNSEACPRNLGFRGSIATNGATTVKYTWESSDHHGWPELELTAKGAGSHPVSRTWTLGERGREGLATGWIQLKTREPNAMESQKVDVKIFCGLDPSYQPGPEPKK